MKKLIFSFLALALAAAVLTMGLYSWWQTQLAPVAPGSTSQTSLVIEPDETGTSALRKLHSAGVIRSVDAARVYLRLSGQSGNLRPGAYSVSPGQSLPEIVTSLASGPKDVWVTIPEGWRREQIAARLKVTFPDFDSELFTTETATLEGQLFPDTYLLPVYATHTDVIRILLANLTKKSSLNPDQSYIVSLGGDSLTYTGRELLVLASLIEREAKADSDRRLVSGILHNRLKLGMPLQVDATVQYARDTVQCQSDPLACRYWQPVYDTKFPSLYNTYQYAGLPPGAIANAGLAAIEAARQPEDSDYLYYLTDDEGRTHYARTLAEHNINIDKYLRP